MPVAQLVRRLWINAATYYTGSRSMLGRAWPSSSATSALPGANAPSGNSGLELFTKWGSSRSNMKILAIAAFVPMPDRAGGDLRFLELLKGLARKHRVLFCAYDTVDWLNEVQLSPYRAALEQSGIIVRDSNPIAAIRSEPFDAILFEYYYSATSYIDDARFWQPAARVLVDSVDVHFNRLFAKARLTKTKEHYIRARQVKRRELATYRKADVVITVSEEDKRILQRAMKNLPVEVIANIHAVPPLVEPKVMSSNSLIFIGNFHHDPNVDAMLYFCKEVLPMLKEQVPDVRLTIVGNSPPEEIQALGRENVEVLGFVPDITPLLEASAISIAPLRYGGGIKGKIAEAMAHGLPVVTTSVGTEGFGLSPGENVLIGDTAEAFAGAVVQLIRDRELYDNIRKAAWIFVNERYSVVAVSKQIEHMLGSLKGYPIKKLSGTKTVRKALRYHLDRHVFWRFK